ncbi:hypothetical protein ABPG72_020009 [Tetrahymena utriculariae]
MPSGEIRVCQRKFQLQNFDFPSAILGNQDAIPSERSTFLPYKAKYFPRQISFFLGQQAAFLKDQFLQEQAYPVLAVLARLRQSQVLLPKQAPTFILGSAWAALEQKSVFQHRPKPVGGKLRKGQQEKLRLGSSKQSICEN